MVRSRSRSFSPDLKRVERSRRSRSRSRERDREKNVPRERRRDEFERRRSRSPRRHRSRSPRRPRSRSKSPRRNQSSRSQKRGRSRSRERNKGTVDMDIEGDQDDLKDSEEAMMSKLMGFSGFDSTKGKHVPGACNASSVKVTKPRKYRTGKKDVNRLLAKQYMNRRGGFNRPLDYVN